MGLNVVDKRKKKKVSFQRYNFPDYRPGKLLTCPEFQGLITKCAKQRLNQSKIKPSLNCYLRNYGKDVKYMTKLGWAVWQNLNTVYHNIPVYPNTDINILVLCYLTGFFSPYKSFHTNIMRKGLML